MKTNYYLIWIEGLNPRTGEKICNLTNDSHEYTTKMTKATRIKEKDLDSVKELLINRGVAEWAITFIQTSYAPKGTLRK